MNQITDEQQARLLSDVLEKKAKPVIEHRSTEAMDSVIREMYEQDRVHGAQRHQSPAVWFPIFVEEVGEVGTAMQEKSNLREELVQVAAVALQWIEDIDRDGVNL